MKPVPAGIIGASGYAGELLLHLLTRHPHLELAAAASRSLAGQSVAEAFPALRASVGDLTFVPTDGEALAAREDVPLWFLALPHGLAAEFAVPLLKAGKRVVDLSADFRIRDAARFAQFYRQPHPAPELLAQAHYIIPEVHPQADWQDASLIACPGCYPTSILLPLMPLAKAGLVEATGIVINSISGLSGAGRKAAEFYSFTERAESVTPYGQPMHRHLAEVEEQLAMAFQRPAAETLVQFNPHLAPLRRGIISTMTVKAAPGVTADRVRECWEGTFAGRPFVHIPPAGKYPDTLRVQGTNTIELSAVHDLRTGNLILSSAEDNLVKGAGGQAVQIVNLLNGWPETAGLL